MPYAIQPSYGELAAAQRGNVPLENILSSAMAGYAAYTQAKETKAKREMQLAESYNTLRKAGYSPSDAHSRTLKGLGWPVPGQTAEEKKTTAETANIEAQTAEHKAKASAYNRVGSLRGSKTSALSEKDALGLSTEKANAIDLITSKDNPTAADAKAAIREQYKTVNLADPEIVKALEQTYAEPDQAPQTKGKGSLGRILAGVLGRVSGPAGAVATIAKSAKDASTPKPKARAGKTAGGVSYVIR